MEIGKLLKLAKGVSSADEALEVLSLMGIELNYTPVAMDAAPASEVLAEILATAAAGGAKGFYSVNANVKGLPLRAFVVLG